MPKIFVSTKVKDGRTYRSVIDGQQRITTILSFLKEGFEFQPPYNGPYLGKYFSELPQDVQDDVLAYNIDFNEAKGLEEEELREVYSRVNKYLVPLNRQELRKADYPGAFIDVAEELANLDAFENFGLFNATARRRSLDVEYLCELLAAQLKDISDKKDAIDNCCRDYANWPAEQKNTVVIEFKNVISDLTVIFDSNFPMRRTRWKQKADFYSLFFAILSLQREGFVLASDLDWLRQDLNMLDVMIAPTSEQSILRKYAVYCISQANSAASRTWRMEFIRNILRGTYVGSISDGRQRDTISTIASQIRFTVEENFNGDGCPPLRGFECDGCGKIDKGEILLTASFLYWPKGTKVFQISNSRWAHSNCKSAISFEDVIEGRDIPRATLDEDEEDIREE